MSLSPSIIAAKKAFAEKHNLPPNNSQTLEAFFTHQVLLHRNLSDFAAQHSWKDGPLLVGGRGDIQLDAIVVLLNNEDVLRPGVPLDELERAVADGERVQLTFIFVQATGYELSEVALTHKLSAFSDGVYAFFDTEAAPTGRVNQAVASWIDYKNQIFAILEEGGVQGCCDCAMYFVSLHPTVRNDDVDHKIHVAKRKLSMHVGFAGYWNDLSFYNIGSDHLDRLIASEGQRSGALTISLERFIKAPVPRGVDVCFCGILTAAEVLKLISETDPASAGGVDQGMFASNIRSFLGSATTVNSSIAATLRDPVQRRQFGLRSNGLSIVARAYQQLNADQVRFTGVQIVNGCQTSNVLFQNRQHLSDAAGTEVWVPAKIIVTYDRAIENAAILALNRQTPVQDAQVFAERDFVDRLAHALKSAPAQHDRIVFEKREGEYRGREEIEPSRIVSLYEVAWIYSAAFLPNPELVAAGGQQPIIEKMSQGKIFGKDESVQPYVLSAAMLYRGREAVRLKHNKPWTKYGTKNLLVFAMRLLAEEKKSLEPPGLYQADLMPAYHEALGHVLLDPVAAKRLAEDAVETVIKSGAATGIKLDAKGARRRELVQNIVERIRGKNSHKRLYPGT